MIAEMPFHTPASAKEGALRPLRARSRDLRARPIPGGETFPVEG